MSNDYRDAATALRQVLSGKAGVKTAVFGARPRNVKRCFALVAEASKRLPLLRSLARLLGPAGRDADPAMVLVLLQEHLFSRGGIKGGGALKRLIVESDAALRAAAGDAVAAAKTAGGDAASTWPRYVRVNTLLAAVPDVVAELTAGGGGGVSEGGGEGAPSSSSTSSSSSSSASAPGSGGGGLSRSEVAVDAHLPMLLALPPDAHKRLALHAHPAVGCGRLVLQDKASALPPYALLEDALTGAAPGWGAAGLPAGWHPLPLLPPPEGGPSSSSSSSGGGGGGGGGGSWPIDVIDACAAPGNKTTELAALLAQLHEARRGAGGAAAGAGAGKKRKRPDAGDAPAAAAAPSVAAVPTVWAFDRSPPRLETLRQRVALALTGRAPAAASSLSSSGSGGGKKSKGTNTQRHGGESSSSLPSAPATSAHPSVRVVCSGDDFTALSPSDPRFARVRAVLLDPSCSGSGMVKAHGALPGGASDAGGGAATAAAPLPPPSEAGRVASLAAFQAAALAHALSFPGVVRVSYSTCSVYAQEDEAVVAGAVASFNASGTVDAASGRPVRVALLRALPAWANRGIPPPPAAAGGGGGGKGGDGDAPSAAAAALTAAGLDWSCCVRCAPDVDRTGGFFVAVLHKCVVDDEEDG
jgi:16S rRNA C967 or C1407 C5-methylase (RsmB/RsmF family)